MEWGNRLSGGVSLSHTLIGEKHCYEVENVLTHCPSNFRKGDKIFMINQVKTEDLTPEKFVKMLKLESPILTIHQASIEKDDKHFLESDFIRPCTKLDTKLDFQLCMVREECLETEEENGREPTECEWESDDTQDNEVLLLSMTKTDVTVVSGRGCDPENPCNNCGNGCNVNDVVIEAETCEVTSVNREYIRKHKQISLYMCSFLQTVKKPESISPFGRRSCTFFSENVTIYYYGMNVINVFSGAPVVLNITGTDNFLKCTCENQQPVLTVESCKSDKLREICKDDATTWPFVFYMTTSKDGLRLFESAANKGWFIQTQKPKVMCVGNPTDETRENFYFLIYSKE
ncbi:uncharacterized protein [Salminus brasiliensis]|uniref:uncharacterized protein n=1 Tax=Salminus brasiliensis TaxID=930266 RepID=UPI003B8398EB